jgi:hypothetical protein
MTEPPSALAPAAAAHATALAFFASSPETADKDTRWVTSLTTQADVQRAVDELRDRAAASARSNKACTWLTSVAQRVAYYGTIMDVLVQYYPEHVALAWGAVKFVFMVRLYGSCDEC